MAATSAEASLEPQSGFKSPMRILVRFFNKSRLQWKVKAMDRRAEIKDLEHKVRHLDQSRTNWKGKAQQLDADKKALAERLRIVEAERARLQATIEEHASKKAPRPVVR